MNKSFIGLLAVGLWACNYDVQYLGEVSDSVAEQGLHLRIGKLELSNPNDDAFIPIEISNVSKDTIYINNLFRFKDYPDSGYCELIISDQSGKIFPRTNINVFKCFGDIDQKSEYCRVLPRMFHQDTLLIDLIREYELEQGKTYSIFAKFVNHRLLPPDSFPFQIPAGCRLWTGILKSNTYKFRL